jgi:hypothetical protein
MTVYGSVPPTSPASSRGVERALVKGTAKELDFNESYLERLADKVRKDLA